MIQTCFLSKTYGLDFLKCSSSETSFNESDFLFQNSRTFNVTTFRISTVF